MTPLSNTLAGMKALVTGASKRVGRGIAIKFARQGCDICAVGCSSRRLIV